MQAAQIKNLRDQDLPSGPMNEQQVSLLRDMQTFLEFCIQNGLSFQRAMGVLAHDVNGILAPESYFERGIFVPQVKGYARKWPETLKEMASMASDPAMMQEHAEDDSQEMPTKSGE
jgi:hypothetical protein